MRHLSKVQNQPEPQQTSTVTYHPGTQCTTLPDYLPGFIVKLPESEGFDTILTITDHDCSKAAMFIRATRRSTQQEWQSCMPPTSSPPLRPPQESHL